jgi:glycosyltransferase involved in cell wall biosynthesis
MSVPGVRFTGQVEDALRYLQAADLFVLPSTTEGLSNSLLEALSVGLPVLATSVGGTPDVIAHGENGYLIPPDDLPALQAGLTILLNDSDLCGRLGTLSRRRVQADFSLESVAARLEALYHRLLATETKSVRNALGG